MRESKNQKKQRAKQVVSLLKKEYPDSKCSLHFSNAHELLIATILSAQCTDHRVNQVTTKLFKKYPRLEDFAHGNLEELAMDIHSCGYHNQKAKSIWGAAKAIVEEFDSVVPNTLEELIKLPGVGKKTANCLLGVYFHVPSLVIDTHMIRIMNLLDFTQTKDPQKIELELMAIFEKKDWVKLTHLVIDHGRKVCIARRPQCHVCMLNKLCPSAFN